LSEDAPEDAADRSPRHRFARRVVALLGLGVLLVATPTAAVKASREPPSRGDVMRMIFTRDHPDAIEALAHAVQQTPAAIDLESARDRGSDRSTMPLPQTQAKGVVPGARPIRRRRRMRPRRPAP
jgi:hypothetical protein